LYVFAGGMRGTAWANAFQTLVFMTLGVVTFVVIANRIGGTESFWENMRRASELVRLRHPEKLTRETISPWVFASYMLIPFSAGTFPHLFQHWLTARRASTFKLPIVAHPIFIMIVWAPCVLVGVWATSATVGGSPSGPLIVPQGLNENAVLGYLVGKLCGPVLSGLLSAGILAAIMSSLDSQFLCLGTIFTNDIVLHYGGRDRFSEKQVVVMARLFIAAIVAVTYALSLLKPFRVFDLGIWCFSGFASLAPLVLACLYWKRLTRAGAYASVMAAAATWAYFFVDSGYGAGEHYTFLGMMPVATITAASTVALLVVSLLTRPPSRATIDKFFGCAAR
ncbi:MAG TPA: sodium:solute symporter family protein, partial [Planctomycetaceae bacterium]|nr:sodium:solute symporter family protein [Planctomycetaceae bacterium]